MENSRMEVLQAEKQYNETSKVIRADISKLGRQRDELGSKVQSLKAELPNRTGAYTKASMEQLIKDTQSEQKEVELELDLKTSELKELSRTDFMGEGSRVTTDKDLRRSSMSLDDKALFLKTHTMGEYLQLRY